MWSLQRLDTSKVFERIWGLNSTGAYQYLPENQRQQGRRQTIIEKWNTPEAGKDSGRWQGSLRERWGSEGGLELQQRSLVALGAVCFHVRHPSWPRQQSLCGLKKQGCLPLNTGSNTGLLFKCPHFCGHLNIVLRCGLGRQRHVRDWGEQFASC